MKLITIIKGANYVLRFSVVGTQFMCLLISLLLPNKARVNYACVVSRFKSGMWFLKNKECKL